MCIMYFLRVGRTARGFQVIICIVFQDILSTNLSTLLKKVRTTELLVKNTKEFQYKYDKGLFSLEWIVEA